jgi:hypothetical protein
VSTGRFRRTRWKPARPDDGVASDALKAPGRVALAAVCAAGVFAASWGFLHLHVYANGQIRDTPVYQGYGEDVVHGEVPYRDFDVEYPPGALPVFVAPAIGSPSAHGYRSRFDLLMLVCGIGAVAAVAAALGALGAGPVRLAAALGLAAVTPLLLGPVVLTRYDLWPAALAAAAFAALCSGRDRLSFALLGLAVTAKVYPAVLAPLFVAHVWRRRGAREAAVAAGIGLGAAAVFAAFVALAPGGVWDTVVRQTTRCSSPRTTSSGLGFGSRRPTARRTSRARCRTPSARPRARSSSPVSSRCGSGSRDGPATGSRSPARAPPPSPCSSPSGRCSHRST